jgi:integrase
MRVAIVIGYRNGMRLGEIVGLTRDRVDVKRRAIRLGGGTKEGDAKNAPLPSDAVGEIEKLPRRIDGRLFSMSPDTASKAFAALCVAVEIDNLHFHDFRHTAVTNFLEAGVDLMTIQTITGHKTLHMTKRYAHISDKRRREAMEKVEAQAATSERS